jgi:transposase-like protein
MAKATTQAQRRRVVQQWRDSGLSAGEFAAEKGIKVNTLHTWRWRLQCEQQKSGGTAEAKKRGATGKGKKPTFIDVTEALTGRVETERGSALQVLVAGVVIRVPVGFDETTLQRLVSVLRKL